MPTAVLPTPRDLLPLPQFVEYHRLHVAASPEAVAAAVHGVGYGEVRLLAPLMAVRQLPGWLLGDRQPRGQAGRPLKDLIGTGFDVLADGSEGYLFVGVEQPFKARLGERRPMGSVEEFMAFDEPGFCRIAADFRVSVRYGITVVSTETVVDCADAATLRAFARYWRLIRPFSGLIRHSMLHAVRRRATGAAAGRVSGERRS